MTSCNTGHVAVLLCRFTWDTRITPTTIKWFCQRNLNEHVEGSSSLALGDFSSSTNQSSDDKDSCAIFEASSDPFVTSEIPFCFLLPWAIKYNPGYGYTRDALWLNSLRGKKCFKMCFSCSLRSNLCRCWNTFCICYDFSSFLPDFR